MCDFPYGYLTDFKLGTGQEVDVSSITNVSFLDLKMIFDKIHRKGKKKKRHVNARTYGSCTENVVTIVLQGLQQSTTNLPKTTAVNCRISNNHRVHLLAILEIMR